MRVINIIIGTVFILAGLTLFIKCCIAREFAVAFVWLLPMILGKIIIREETDSKDNL